MNKQANKIVGNKGETLACEYLQLKGYQILQRNYRSKWGEVDIICKISNHKPALPRGRFSNSQNEDIVVFVEVKTKTTDKYGEPWEMVNAWKIDQVKRMGELWCLEHDWQGRVRVDVVGVYLYQDPPRIEHWESVDL